jgi:hypothetical protein
MDAIEIILRKLPHLYGTLQLLDVAMVLLDNPGFAQAVIDNQHSVTAGDLMHDIRGLMTKDEFFVTKIS